jgi:hypothetical protein
MLTGSALAQASSQPPVQDRQPVQHGTQPNPGEVRPSSPDGDAPAASAGTLAHLPARRILGLPVTTALVIAGVLVALTVLAGIVIPSAARRRRPRGGGTYDRGPSV